MRMLAYVGPSRIVVLLYCCVGQRFMRNEVIHDCAVIEAVVYVYSHGYTPTGIVLSIVLYIVLYIVLSIVLYNCIDGDGAYIGPGSICVGRRERGR